jgi:hypothetical protein
MNEEQAGIWKEATNTSKTLPWDLPGRNEKTTKYLRIAYLDMGVYPGTS